MTIKTTEFIPPKKLKLRQGLDFFAPDYSTTSPFVTRGSLRMDTLSPQPDGAVLRDLARNPDIELRERVAALQIPPSPSSLSLSPKGSDKPLEERLFDATANVKILTAQVAMHLDREWRDRLFLQLDSIHDPDEWEEQDSPIQHVSFSTFLKAIFEIKPKVMPGLGLSNGGNLVAAWTSDRTRLTIEFISGDRVRWVLSSYPDGELEQFAGTASVTRLSDCLNSYGLTEWFGDAE